MILPARIGNSDLALRPLRLRDCRRFLRLDREAGSGSSSPVIPARYSWPRLWWRLRRRLDICYAIDVNGTACGLIGLYDLDNNNAARVALAIFDPSCRRKGIGSAALSLLIDMLMRRHIAGHLLAEVGSGDDAALGFWIKQGFVQTAAANGGLILSRYIRQAAKISPRPAPAGQEGYGSRPGMRGTAGSA